MAVGVFMQRWGRLLGSLPCCGAGHIVHTHGEPFGLQGHPYVHPLALSLLAAGLPGVLPWLCWRFTHKHIHGQHMYLLLYLLVLFVCWM